MKLKNLELADLMVEVANKHFGSGKFCRRELMDMTEREVRRRGLWTPADDRLSHSKGTKTVGLANIDYRFSSLAERGTIVSEQRNVWRLASPKPPSPRKTLQRTKVAAQDTRLYPDEVDSSGPYSEGAVHQVTVNAYERDAEARKKCIAHYGARCFVCGFDFQLVYGTFAKGFIHVHHIIPLSQIGDTYEVHPLNDLRPVCPNCHAIIHLGGNCRSIDEVKQSLQEAKGLTGTSS
jgi:5-methylcytosine-specific restriction endonuclease McrA